MQNRKKTQFNVGTYLGARLEEVGVKHFFCVPGDFNLMLLDKLMENLEIISCCNELNAGYAADGYARARGVSVVVVTFMVGSLSLINAIAGAFSDDLPVIVISGGLNSNDLGTNRVIHHTTGLENKMQALEIFKQVTCATELISHAVDAPAQIDKAISSALIQSKPVYIELSCNIISEPAPRPIPFFIQPIPRSNPESLASAVDAAAEMINSAQKVVLVAGARMRRAKAFSAFRKLADAIGCAVATMPDAKGMFPETHPSYIGTYWVEVSSPCCCEIVESSDVYLFAGPVFNDYTTVGYSALLKRSKMIECEGHRGRVKMPEAEFGCVYMAEFLENLADRVKKNDTTLRIYARMRRPEKPVEEPDDYDVPLTASLLYKHVQNVLNDQSVVLSETGDAWFNGQRLCLPENAKYEVQMQYGSIGWSVGAAFGYAVAAGDQRRVIALIGDGSFQMSAQEVSSMIRYKTNPIIVLVNNSGYTIESEIHEGPYNRIKNWNYAGLVQVFNAEDGTGLGVQARTLRDLADGLERAKRHTEGPVLVECLLDKDDCSKELLEWGARVANANNRPPAAAEDFLM